LFFHQNVFQNPELAEKLKESVALGQKKTAEVSYGIHSHIIQGI
jgi:hypothetical protein